MALTLQACSGQPAKSVSEGDLAKRILKHRPLEGDLQCPSRYTRACTGAGASLKCGCLTPDDLRRALGRAY
jgi:hypothetical protein